MLNMYLAEAGLLNIQNMKGNTQFLANLKKITIVSGIKAHQDTVQDRDLYPKKGIIVIGDIHCLVHCREIKTDITSTLVDILDRDLENLTSVNCPRTGEIAEIVRLKNRDQTSGLSSLVQGENMRDMTGMTESTVTTKCIQIATTLCIIIIRKLTTEDIQILNITIVINNRITSKRLTKKKELPLIQKMLPMTISITAKCPSLTEENLFP